MSGALLDRAFGVYEKALPVGPWRTVLTEARAAGFDYVEMSIDESDARLARLDWTRDQRLELVELCASLEVPIYSICLSGHRRYGLGSSDPAVRAKASQMLDSAIGLACDLGVRVIQVAGYFAYYEPPAPAARARYAEGLAHGVELAARRGVMLAVENIDTIDMASIADCLALRDELRSPWFQIYPDIGNLVVHGLDVLEQLPLIQGAAVGLHLKDARPGEPRRVAFGDGNVPFEAVFECLSKLDFSGPLTVEMWNDDGGNAGRTAEHSLRWLKDRIGAATGAMAGGAA